MKLRRFIKTVVVFVLLGAMLNFAIAWATAFWTIAPWVSSQPFAAVSDPSLAPYQFWNLYQMGSFGGLRVMSQPDGAGLVPSGALPDEFSDLMSRLPERSAERRANGDSERVPPLIVEARGWPCLALRCEWDFRYGAALKDGIGLPPNQPRGTGPWQVSPGSLRALPCRPVWRGFITNTVCYALVLWIMSASLAYLLPSRIRARRLKRGVCPRCKYPIGESPVCTECGTPLHTTPVARS